MRAALRIALPVAAVFFLGCCPAVVRLHDGTGGVPDEIAVLLAAGGGVGIVRVDDRSTTCVRDTAAECVEVLPGQHEVEVSWETVGTSVAPGYRASGLLFFVAEAGRTYNLMAARGTKGVVFWALDESSGAVVAATAPGSS